jgi:hypothetical protein
MPIRDWELPFKVLNREFSEAPDLRARYTAAPTGESEPQGRGAGRQRALGEDRRLITFLELELELLPLEPRIIGRNDQNCVGQSGPIRDLFGIRRRRRKSLLIRHSRSLIEDV